MNEIKQFYTQNFDLIKRKKKNIKFLVFHYTGMKTEKSAIERLSDNNSKVSCHYFIKKNGTIINLVPDLYISWHAGISNWKKFKKINKFSIGIEIHNPGHQYGYKRFNKKQINPLKLKMPELNTLNKNEMFDFNKQKENITKILNDIRR